MDLVAGLVSDYAIVRDPEFNVAYWNLHARTLDGEGGRYTVDGRPLALLPLQRLRPDQPSPEPAPDPDRASAIIRRSRRICREYADALLEARATPGQPLALRLRRLADGTPLTSRCGGCSATGEERDELHGSPFTRDGCEAFLTWAGAQDAGRPAGINALLASSTGRDRTSSRPSPTSAGADRLALPAGGRATTASRNSGSPRGSPHPRRRAARRPRGRGRSTLPSRSTAVEPRRGGSNVVGYFRSELGVGEAARQVVSALDAADVPLLPLHGRTIPPNRQGHPFTHLDHTRRPLSGEPDLHERRRAPRVRRSRRAGSSSTVATRSDCGSGRCGVARRGGASIRAASTRSGRRRPRGPRAVSGLAGAGRSGFTLPIEMPRDAATRARPFGCRDGFMFLFSFDYLSVFERKNPLALVEAFRRRSSPTPARRS